MKINEIKRQCNNGEWQQSDVLYLATEDQISDLIDREEISEDFYSRHQDYQEEMCILLAEARLEFSL